MSLRCTIVEQISARNRINHIKKNDEEQSQNPTQTEKWVLKIEVAGGTIRRCAIRCSLLPSLFVASAASVLAGIVGHDDQIQPWPNYGHLGGRQSKTGHDNDMSHIPTKTG